MELFITKQRILHFIKYKTMDIDGALWFGIQQFTIHNAIIQKTTFFEIGVYNKQNYTWTLENKFHTP